MTKLLKAQVEKAEKVIAEKEQNERAKPAEQKPKPKT